MAVQSSSDRLKHGDRAPDFKLRSTDGRLMDFSSANDARAILVIFICNHCPYVKAKIDAINSIAKDYKDGGLVVFGINSNDASEYPEDSFENMQKWSEEKGFTFHYLHDETQEVAKAYGAACTPDPFLFDAQRSLAYHGRIDDGHGPMAAPSTYELRNAIQDVLSGREVSVQEHPSIGCSIKWKK